MAASAELLKRLLHGVDYAMKDFKAGELLILGLNDDPGRLGAMGAEKHFVHGLLIGRPFFSIALVFIGDFPLLFGRVLAFMEAAQLLFGRYVKPEFK